LVEIKADTGQDIVEHRIRLAKVLPGSIVMVSYATMQISKLGLLRDTSKINVCQMSWLVGKRVVVVSMYVLIG